MPEIILLLTFGFEILTDSTEKLWPPASEMPLWPSSYFFTLLASYMSIGTCPNPRHPDWSSSATQEAIAMASQVSSHSAAPGASFCICHSIPAEMYLFVYSYLSQLWHYSKHFCCCCCCFVLCFFLTSTHNGLKPWLLFKESHRKNVLFPTCPVRSRCWNQSFLVPDASLCYYILWQPHPMISSLQLFTGSQIHFWAWVYRLIMHQEWATSQGSKGPHSLPVSPVSLCGKSVPTSISTHYLSVL